METKNKYLAVEGHADTWEEAIRLCGTEITKYGYAGQDFVEACVDREKEYPTGLPAVVPVAIPHSKVDSISENTICFLRLDEPVRFYRMDDAEEYCDTKLIFNLAIKGAEDHMRFLQKLMQFVMNEEAMERCMTMSLDDVKMYLVEVLDSI